VRGRFGKDDLDELTAVSKKVWREVLSAGGANDNEVLDFK
jgi:hypothetical protein